MAEVPSSRLASEVRGMNLKEEGSDAEDMDTIPVALPADGDRSPVLASAADSSTPRDVRRPSRSPTKIQSATQSPMPKTEEEDHIGGGVSLKLEPGKQPKLSRSVSQKVEKRAPQMFLEYENKTSEATSSFQVLPECIYANKYMGITDPALECDCAEEWDATTKHNNACGEDSDCINRATKMECARDCGCGSACENQRFLRKQWANVSVIKTEKKGYGLRADSDLEPNDFVFEYIGEVIGEQVFRRKMQQYDEEGIKHFYFMSLNKGEFVDATKKGNLGRFCNHSCNPNAYVDKWVVGDRLRMGIFAERHIKAGEEIVFNYNVDRYGADPQPCYCGEPNCTGYIGGRTQTERATKLSKATIEALGIDDADAWDTATAKKPRKKKTGEDDEEYVNNVEPRELDEGGVRSVMAQLPQCKEKWIAVKLLNRLQRATDAHIINQVVRMHGYRHLKTAIGNFFDDVNICLQILDVLDKLPRITKNKIQDSKIEDAVLPLVENEDERVSSQAKALLEAWSKLEIGYRIPRMKRDPALDSGRKADRRDDTRRRTRSRSRSKSPDRISAPTGPRTNAPMRHAFRPPPRFRPPPPAGDLPPGWFQSIAPNGSIYYYDRGGNTSWQRPSMPAMPAPPPPPPKAISDQQAIQDLIKNIVGTQTETSKPVPVVAPVETPKKERKEDKWKSLPEEKQKKLYEGTLQPHIMHVVNKFKKKMDKEDLKKLAKEISKKIVATDFKSKRIEHPSKISDKHAKSVRKYAHETFARAIKKKAEHDKRKSSKAAPGEESHTPPGSPQATAGSADIDEPVLSDDEDDTLGPEATPAGSESSTALKRHRDEDDTNDAADDAVLKKLRTEQGDSTPPAPPPPPPPADFDQDPMDTDIDTVRDITATDGETIAIDTSLDVPNGDDANAGFSIKGASSRPGSAHADHKSFEPMQTATPPTTGSPDQDEADKAAKRAAFGGMNPARMRQLGLLDGCVE
nr:hypothetical protein B0A51_04283 [Rachicladosporium sp. CCFEE 5018]